MKNNIIPDKQEIDKFNKEFFEDLANNQGISKPKLSDDDKLTAFINDLDREVIKKPKKNIDKSINEFLDNLI